jgi:Heterokaryon incompatibility protein (HET)
MRLLKLGSHGELSLTKDFGDDAPRYAILSHTWNKDDDKEVIFSDVENKSGTSKAGYAKLQFCGKQAKRDGLEYFWVDTCCINKANHAELSEAIASMFRWYRDAQHCYVYLSDVPIGHDSNEQPQQSWEPAFRKSRWFTRGWTLQELIAPKSVKFFSQEEELLGDKKMLGQIIQEITGVPFTALSGSPLTQFSIEERLQWAVKRNTKRKEDRAYCLLGIFDVFIPLIYGEGDHAFIRLKEEIDKRSGKMNTAVTVVRPGTRLTSSGASAPLTHEHWMVTRHANPLFTGRKDLLQELDSIVRDAMKNPSNQTQCRIVLSGMGGQGKSELCLQLAHGLRHL